MHINCVVAVDACYLLLVMCSLVCTGDVRCWAQIFWTVEVMSACDVVSGTIICFPIKLLASECSSACLVSQTRCLGFVNAVHCANLGDHAVRVHDSGGESMARQKKTHLRLCMQLLCCPAP